MARTEYLVFLLGSTGVKFSQVDTQSRLLNIFILYVNLLRCWFSCYYILFCSPFAEIYKFAALAAEGPELIILIPFDAFAAIGTANYFIRAHFCLARTR